MSNSNEDLKKRLAEYAALEARMHSDSRISYSIFVGFTVAALTFMVSVFTLYYQGIIGMSVAAPFFLVPFLLLALAEVIRGRFDYTGDIRMARAVEIEEQLGFYSFRLFEPWKITPSEKYYRILGEIAESRNGDGVTILENGLKMAGMRYFNNPPQRVSKTLGLMRLVVGLVFGIYAIAIMVTFFIDLARISGTLLTASAIIIVIIIVTGVGNWYTRE